MKKIKNNKIIDLKNKNEYEKSIELGEISKDINSIFKKITKNNKMVNCKSNFQKKN